jgi:hypothetical protein
MSAHPTFVDSSFPVDSVVISAQLEPRPKRAPDYEGESRALNELAAELAKPAGNILKKLTDAALALCHAHTAGISILEMSEGKRIFRWHAVSGKWASYEGGTMPREASPCGTILDRNHYELMAAPERHYVAMRGVEPSIREVLLIPFSLLGAPVGTIWVIAHDDSLRFDNEDVRLLGNLACFAATAYVLYSTLQITLEQRDELIRTNTRLRRYQVGAKDAAVSEGAS